MLKKLLKHHILATLCYLLILGMGIASYLALPVQQNPSIHFNWVVVNTLYPGASPSEIEKSVTKPLEDAIERLDDLRFVISTSRDSISNIMIRFQSMSDKAFEDRLDDLRREVQDVKGDLPASAADPKVVELNSSNAFASATLMLTGRADDLHLRHYAKQVKEDIERMPAVDSIRATALQKLELQVRFDLDALSTHQLNPIMIANTLQNTLKDMAAGSVQVDTQRWLVRWEGAVADPEYVSNIAIQTQDGEVLLGSVADVFWGMEKPTELARFNQHPAVMLGVLKKPDKDVLMLVSDIEQYIDAFNAQNKNQGVELTLTNDTSYITEDALSVMQSNAMMGLLLVLIATWAFLGIRLASLVAIGIPFSVAGAFIFLLLTGNTLNISVLLGVVIVLGMLVDDAVVVIESVYYYHSRGESMIDAILLSLKETAGPVFASVLTTVCAFLPLMLLPGIIGQFMRVVPIVVSVALLISLIEAFWLLPSHAYAVSQFSQAPPMKPQKMDWRLKMTRWIRHRYTDYLIRFLRHPKRALSALSGLALFIVLTVASGIIPVDFFASEPLRMFFVNIQMPAQTPIEQTMAVTNQVEKSLKTVIPAEALKSMTSYAGMSVGKTEVMQGPQVGQVFVTLSESFTNPEYSVKRIIEQARSNLPSITQAKMTFLMMEDGPPSGSPIKVSVRGPDFQSIDNAVNAVEALLEDMGPVHDIKNDATLGQNVLTVQPDLDAIYRAHVSPEWVMTMTRLLVDGVSVTDVNTGNELVPVRLKTNSDSVQGLEQWLNQSLVLPSGQWIRLKELVTIRFEQEPTRIRHYDFKRAVTVTADLDKTQMNTVEVNKRIEKTWATIADQHPGIDLVLAGELDDIQESLDQMPYLFLLGLGLIYLVLGTQFHSYFQPLMVITAIPMSFLGVILGLLLTGHPLSLYTIYGVVALSGISVNAAIVLMSAANQRLEMGLSVFTATVLAARRRVIPILITTLTTIAGLLSLALGIGGQSSLWGPVATAIVFGLMFATVLTLFFQPLFFVIFNGGYHQSGDMMRWCLRCWGQKKNTIKRAVTFFK